MISRPLFLSRFLIQSFHTKGKVGKNFMTQLQSIGGGDDLLKSNIQEVHG